MRGRTTRRAFLGQSLLAPGALAGFRALSCRALEPTREQSPAAEAEPTLDEILDRYWDQIHPAMRYRRAPLDPALNGWEEWERAASLLTSAPAELPWNLIEGRIFPTGECGKAIEAWIKENQKALETGHRLTQAKQIQLPLHNTDLAARMESHKRARKIGELSECAIAWHVRD